MDKKEETKRLTEFIQMEQEKLGESKRTFEDDKERYEQYLDALRTKVAEVEEEVKGLTKVKNEKKDEIREKTDKIHEINSECMKIDDQLEVHRDNQGFIKELGE